MIGGWMRHANGKCYQVTRIDGLHDGSIHFACGTPHLWEYNNKFEPIPLTAEILDRNGFTQGISGGQPAFLLQGEYYDVTVQEENDSIWCVEYYNTEFDMPILRNRVCYVHELQIVLALYGLEKDITMTEDGV